MQETFKWVFQGRQHTKHLAPPQGDSNKLLDFQRKTLGLGLPCGHGKMCVSKSGRTRRSKGRLWTSQQVSPVLRIRKLSNGTLGQALKEKTGSTQGLAFALSLSTTVKRPQTLRVGYWVVSTKVSSKRGKGYSSGTCTTKRLKPGYRKVRRSRGCPQL